MLPKWKKSKLQKIAFNYNFNIFLLASSLYENLDLFINLVERPKSVQIVYILCAFHDAEYAQSMRTFNKKHFNMKWSVILIIGATTCETTTICFECSHSANFVLYLYLYWFFLNSEKRMINFCLYSAWKSEIMNIHDHRRQWQHHSAQPRLQALYSKRFTFFSLQWKL